MDRLFRGVAGGIILHKNKFFAKVAAALFEVLLDNRKYMFSVRYTINVAPILVPDDSRTFTGYAGETALEHLAALLLWASINVIAMVLFAYSP